jgi:hypothetical protein
LVVASLLSPGGSGACAGCCDVDSPTVVATLAAGIAPVHVAAVVDAAPRRCCHSPGGDAAAVAESCCSGLDQGTIPGTVGCETPANQTDPCSCRLTPRDDASAVPVRAHSDDLRAAAAVCGSGFHATGSGAGPMAVANFGPVLPVHARPLRVLYGVWRN